MWGEERNMDAKAPGQFGPVGIRPNKISKMLFFLHFDIHEFMQYDFD
jgi:hypothetical protein